jgi:hypothetical protein
MPRLGGRVVFDEGSGSPLAPETIPPLVPIPLRDPGGAVRVGPEHYPVWPSSKSALICLLCMRRRTREAAAVPGHRLPEQVLDLRVHTPELLRGHPPELIP